MTRKTISPRLAAVCLGLILVIGAAAYWQSARRHAIGDDEALYGSAGLAILDGDFLLHHTRVMKPFVVYYLQALSRAVAGRTDLAGRLPGIVAALLCLALVYRIGARWFDERVGLWAAGWLAVSPFVLLHFPNARTDAPALLFVLAAVALAGRGRTAWAGFAYALAFATRQLAAFSLPVVAAFVWLDAATSPSPPAAFWRWAGRETARFAKGAALPVLVLLAWSSYTQEPFGWLVRELGGDKYQTGRHAQMTFAAKFLYWIDQTRGLFGAGWLTNLILLLVFATAIYLAIGLARRWWRPRENPTTAALAVMSGFVVFFYLAHSCGFFTLYPRFLVPVAPWIALVAAAGLTAILDRLGEAAPRLRVPLAIGAGLASLLAIGPPAVDFLRAQAEPRPVDDVPAVVSWIAGNGEGKPVLIVGGHGSEAGYYARGTNLKVQHFGRRPEKLRPLIVSHLDRELYLYLDGRELAQYLKVLRQELAPAFRLEAATELKLRRGVLYRIKTAAEIGIVDGQATFLDGADFQARPLTCELAGRLLAESFAALRDDRTAAANVVELRECEIAGGLRRLVFAAEDFSFDKLTIARATFAYRDLEPDWDHWLAARRFHVRRAAEADGLYQIDPAALADYIARKNSNLTEVRAQLTGDRLRIAARAALPLWRPALLLEGELRLDGEKLLLRPTRAEVAGCRLPAWLLRRVAKQINPVFTANLSRFGLRPAALGESGGRLELRAVGLPATP
ncbi:MAG: hypothetical protein GX444_19510 [Myxococcales bacterium]|nr:hypothetical protein [Myxococcales bacterium]